MSILRVNRVMDCLGVRRTSIHEAVKNGTLTKPVRITTRAIGWPQYEIEAIITARIAGQSTKQIQALVDTLHQRRLQLLQGA